MRIPLTFLASLLLALGIARQQASDNSCGFVLAGDLSHATVKGPNDIVPLVYVVDQPDSPLEVVSVDLEGMWLSISNEQHTEQVCASTRFGIGATGLFRSLASRFSFRRAVEQAEGPGQQARHYWRLGRPSTSLILAALKAMVAPKTTMCGCSCMWTQLI